MAEEICLTQGPNTRETYFSMFADMKENGDLCDVAIHVGNQMLQAHRVVLAAGIPYFRSMFMSNMVECRQRNIFMQEVDASALKSIIDFIYFNKLKITSTNVKSLLEVSAYLQFDFVTSSCLEFLLQQINISNVLTIRTYAETAIKPDVVEMTNCYISNHFERFSTCEEFLKLDFCAVKDIISREDLLVASEETVFRAVMRWIQAHEDQHIHFNDLLQCVRVTLLSLKYLCGQVLNAELVQTSPSFLSTVSNTIKRHARDMKKKTYHFVPRLEFPASRSINGGRHYTEVMYAIYGSHSGSISITSYNPFKTEWDKLPNSPDRRNTICYIVCTKEKMYFLCVQRYVVLNLQTLKLSKQKFKDKCPRGAGIVLHHCRPYFFGSSDTKISKNVYTLDLNDGACTHLGEIVVQRKWPKAVSLGDDIFIIGGNSHRVRLKSCERYNPETRVSTEISPMLTVRNYYDCAAVKGKIYVYGLSGTQNNFYACTGEVYNPLVDQWSTVKQMNHATQTIHLSSYTDKLFAFSLVQNPQGKKCYQIEVYEPSEDEWQIVNPLPDTSKHEEPSILVVTNSAVQFPRQLGCCWDSDSEHSCLTGHPMAHLMNFHSFSDDSSDMSHESEQPDFDEDDDDDATDDGEIDDDDDDLDDETGDSSSFDSED